MKASASLIILAAISLSACGIARSLSQPFVQPIAGDTAKVRVITNGRVRFIPNQTCVGWDSPDVGVVASGGVNIGKSFHHNGQNLGMTPSELIPEKAGYVSSEVRVRANQPLTMYFDVVIESGGWIYSCKPMAKAFIPLAGEEYDVLASMDEKCWLYAKTLGQKDKLPAQRWVENCQ